jgi:hypothetical protein
MSATTSTPSAPFQQWQNFYPSGPGQYPSYDMPTTVHEQIYATVTGNAERTKQQAANDIARDILRAVDNNGSHNTHITEINAANINSAIERNGSLGMSTTQRVNSQLASAVERNGAANQSAIERTTGEARLTTVIADAASRQAANDTARDILRSVDRAGLEAVTSTKDSYNGLLASVERNAGEGRIQTLTSSGILDNSMRDIRYSILSDVNRVGNELNASGVQTFNVLNKAITDSAWEQRTAVANGFQNISEEHLRTKFDLNKGIDSHYSSLLLEQQKLGHFMSAKSDGHFASTTLEMQKVKEGLASQSALQYANTQLELQKVKEGLAHQASSYNAVALLEAHKNREAIQKDLADAKYEALKSQQYLGDKIDECCCAVKEKMDVIDRDRLRDNLIVSREDNNVLKILEFGGYGGYGRGYGGRGDRGDHHGRH